MPASTFGLSPNVTVNLDRVEIRLGFEGTVEVGNVVKVSDTTAEKVVKVSSNVYDGLVVGVATKINTDGTVTVRIIGRIDGLTGLTRGKPVFISTTGLLTTDFQLTGHRQIMGVALSATSILLNVQNQKVISI